MFLPLLFTFTWYHSLIPLIHAHGIIEKVYNQALFQAHGINSYNINNWHYKPSSSSPIPSNQPTIILGCGPSVSYTQKRNQLLSVAKFVDVATVRFEQEETCLIAHMLSSDITHFEDSEWTFENLPPILKINQNVINHISYRANFVEGINSERTISEPDAVSFHNATVSLHAPESKSLTVQFIPGDVQSVETTTARVIASWEDRTAATLQNSMHGGVWTRLGTHMRSRFHTDLEQSSARRCRVPASTIFEFEDTAARLVDLSGWSTKESNLECLQLLVDAFAMHPDVVSVSVQGRPVLLNYDARGVTQSGISTSTPFTDAGIIGEGHIVGVSDSGLDDYSCFFWDNSEYYGSASTTRSKYNNPSVERHRRKVVQYVAYADGYDGEAGHGTHVVGTICGDSIFGGFSKANGVAPGAKVAFYDVMGSNSVYLSIPDLYTYLFRTLYNAGARVMSNSWGSYSGQSEYDERSYDADYFLYTYPDALIIFAAGNSGSQGTKTVYSPCTSKNVLCVGSVDLRNDDDDEVVASSESRVSFFSSMGPTYDGRIKPEIVSTGNKIVSAMSSGWQSEEKSCGVYETFGTSMAAPTVAGNAILLREYFENKYMYVCRSDYAYCRSFTPTGYLLKAMLIHCTDAVNSYSETAFNSKTQLSSYTLQSPPDNVQGYGALNLADVPLTTSQRKKYDLYVRDEFSYSPNSEYVVEVYVSRSNKPLKITLAWYDRPSTIGNSYNLLQADLTLFVSHSSSKNSWYGNRGTSSYRDSVNPQEQVTITKPATGVYKVYVTSRSSSVKVKGALVISCNGNIVSEPTSTTTTVTGEVNNNNALMKTPPNSTDEYVVSTLRGSSSESAPADDTRVLPTQSGGAVSSSGGYSIVQSFSINTILSPQTEVCTHRFSTSSSRDVLHSITLDLDATYLGGSAAFILGVNLYAPSGETVQVGGYYNYKASDRLWNRMWPVQWAGATAPVDGSSQWISTRNLIDAELREVGEWKLCLEMLYDSWETTQYSGSVTLRFIDIGSLSSSSKSKSTENSGSISDTALVLIVFFLALGASLVVGLVIRKRVEIVDAVNRLKRRRQRGKATVARRSKQDAGSDGEGVSLNQAPASSDQPVEEINAPEVTNEDANASEKEDMAVGGTEEKERRKSPVRGGGMLASMTTLRQPRYHQI